MDKYKEHCGMPFSDEAEELMKEEEEKDPWEYATTFGEKYEVITREDGSLTVKLKDAI